MGPNTNIPHGVCLLIERCYYGVKLSDKAGWNEMIRNKVEQLEKCTIRKVGEGMAQVFNNLSHPLRFTLNQGAVGSTPTRPTKFFNHLHQYAPVPVLPPFGHEYSE